jgi:hypothetical protein
MSPDAVRRLEPPEGAGRDAKTWVAAHGGVLAGSSVTNVVVQTAADREIVLRAFTIRVTARSTAVPGAAVFVLVDPQCGGGPRDIVYVDANLDQDPVRVNARDMNGTHVDLNALPYAVTPGHSVTFSVSAASTNCDCTWLAELRYVDRGEERILRIDDHGKPFRLSQRDGNPQCYSRLHGNTWTNCSF